MTDTTYESYSGIWMDSYEIPAFVERIRDVIADSPIAESVTFLPGFPLEDDEEPDEDENDFGDELYPDTVWYIHNTVADEYMAVIYDDGTGVSLKSSPDWADLVGKVLEIMEEQLQKTNPGYQIRLDSDGRMLEKEK